MGPRYGRRTGRVNRLRWLRMVCVDIQALWHPGFLQQFSWMVSIDPIGVWGEKANPLTEWCLEVAHYVDGSRWSQSVLGDVSITELLCMAHWNVWRYLQSSSWFAAHPLSFLCRRRWDPTRLFFVGIKSFCNVQLTRDYRRSGAGFELTPQMKMPHSESISWRLRNQCLALPVWSRATTMRI